MSNSVHIEVIFCSSVIDSGSEVLLEFKLEFAMEAVVVIPDRICRCVRNFLQTSYGDTLGSTPPHFI